MEPEHILNRPIVDVESAFNEFVEEFGGELISKAVPANPEENADYLFRDEGVVAELKCLQKDFFAAEDFSEKILNLYQKWEKVGLVNASQIIKISEGKGRLPEECSHDVGELVKKPIEAIIKKANRQIKASKAYFGLPDAKGLLLIANDGNFTIGTASAKWVFQRILYDKFSTINEVSYFTVNMDVCLPGDYPPGPIWFHSYRQGMARISSAFQQSLREGWHDFVCRKLGRFGFNVALPNPMDINELRFINHPRRPYKQSKTTSDSE